VEYLCDTNIILRRYLPSDPVYSLVRAAMRSLHAAGHQLYCTPQNLIEFQALATRPREANGLGLSALVASRRARRIEALHPLLPDTPEVYRRWRALVDAYDVRGRQVYDTRLVAVMLTHGVTHLLTLDPKDFRRFSEITVVEPHQVR
jgi:predicted nucleic acid-binding protein